MILLKLPKSRTFATPNSGKNVEQQEYSFIAAGSAKCFSHFGRQFLTKLDIFFPNDPETTLLDIYPKKLKIYLHTKTCTHMFKGALAIILKS